jgi:DNA-binding CsgD family transcriptional regulator
VSDDAFEADDLPQAVRARAESHGWRAALALETAHWDRYVHSRPDALLASIRSLPGEAFVEVPSLLVAVNYLQHLITGADPTRFHDITHDDQDRPVAAREPLDQLIASAGRTAGLRTAGRFEAAAQAASEGREALDQLPGPQRAPLNSSLPHLLTQWGRALELNDDGGIREYQEAWELATLSKQGEIARRAASSLAWLHADHGRLNEADRWIVRARDTAAKGGRYEAPLHLALAMTASDRLDLPAATEHLATLDTVPIGEYWAAAAWMRARVAHSEAEAVRVETLIADQLRTHSPRLSSSGANRRYITAARASLALARDKRFDPQPASEATSAFDDVVVAASSYRAGMMHDALRRVAPALKTEVSTRLRIAAFLLTAAARLSLGRRDAAAEAFVHAHALIEEERMYHAYGIIASDHRTALSTLTNLEIHETAVGADFGERSAKSQALASLTRRERQMLAHLASDASPKQIAEAMFVSPNTVKTLTSLVYRKLGVHSRREAADIAHSAGLA